MNLRSFLLGSVLALGANALLVLPDMDGDVIAPQRDFTGLYPVEAFQQQVELICKECPFRQVNENGDVSWTDGFLTSLALNFSIEDHALLVNGHRIFPPPPPSVITAVQRRKSDGAESDPISLGYAIEFMPLGLPDDAPIEASAVRFTVLDLDGHPVPLDTVAITILKDLRGNIYMAKTDFEDTVQNRLSWKQCRGKPNCLRKLLVERIRGLFAAAKARILGMRPRPFGCDRSRPMLHPYRRPEGDFDHDIVPGRRPHPGDEGPFGLDGRPHHHHHMHHMHHGGWERTVSRMFRFIVVPAVLGVLAGLAASALGMLAGQIVIFLWQRRRRSAPTETVEEGTAPEKQGLMTETSDELPAYSDDEIVEVSDTKQ